LLHTKTMHKTVSKNYRLAVPVIAIIYPSVNTEDVYVFMC
jgi:hypothetical protein